MAAGSRGTVRQASARFEGRAGLNPSRRTLVGLFAMAALLTACDNSSRPSPPSDIGGPFQLTDQNGGRVDQRILLGKWSAVFFGYTFCPDVCPTTLTTLATAIDRLGSEARRFQVIFVTIDPARDTPTQLKTYLSSPAFPKGTIGLTGTPTEIAQIARGYRVYYGKAGEGPDYSMDHTAIVYLMDPRGRFSQPIGFGQAPARIAEQIKSAMRGG